MKKNQIWPRRRWRRARESLRWFAHRGVPIVADYQRRALYERASAGGSSSLLNAVSVSGKTQCAVRSIGAVPLRRRKEERARGETREASAVRTRPSQRTFFSPL
ncbi:hypothetical protein MRX96_042321 [Rhipicephalus microplus]